MEKKEERIYNILLVGPRERLYDEMYVGIWGVALGNRYCDRVAVEYMYPEDYIAGNGWGDLDVVIDISEYAIHDAAYARSKLKKIIDDARENVALVFQKKSSESAFEYLARMIKELDLFILGDRDDWEGVKH